MKVFLFLFSDLIKNADSKQRVVDAHTSHGNQTTSQTQRATAYTARRYSNKPFRGMTLIICSLVKSHHHIVGFLINMQVQGHHTHHRALTRILKTGVQDSHLAKSRSPIGKSGSPTQKKLGSHQFVHTVYSILAGSDTFE